MSEFGEDIFNVKDLTIPTSYGYNVENISYYDESALGTTGYMNGSMMLLGGDGELFYSNLGSISEYFNINDVTDDIYSAKLLLNRPRSYVYNLTVGKDNSHLKDTKTTDSLHHRLRLQQL